MAGRRSRSSSTTFTHEEKAAMREAAAERRKAARRGGRASQADGEADLLEKVAEMDGTDRELAERLHAIVKEHAPDLAPRTWYGMPAYARDGAVVCFFQSSKKFKTRYATLGFSDKARLDDGELWPVAFALTTITPEVERRIAALVQQAVRPD